MRVLGWSSERLKYDKAIENAARDKKELSGDPLALISSTGEQAGWPSSA